MADTNKKEYTSNLHPKGDLGTTVYPNVKSENIIDKDTTAYTAGKVPDSSLVTKSLDGLNEKIETNKIQTDTNKTNIATLQGDVAGLKQDNETTKTTIAGLVSADTQNKANITKNTQDIATNAQNIKNLSAVTPTDINVDSNYNLILEHNGTEITGQNKKLKYTIKYKKNSRDFNILDGLGGQGISVLFNKDNGGLSYLYIGNIGYKHLEIYETGNDDIQCGFNNTKIEFPHPLTKSRIYKLPDISGTMALTSDLDAKQDKRFVHTVEIHYASNGSYFCFTGTSDKNTPIDSVEKLTTVFANRDLGGTGIFGSAGLSKIHVGSSVNDTTFKKYMNNGEYANPSEETFAMVFNTTGFTITDSVSAL